MTVARDAGLCARRAAAVLHPRRADARADRFARQPGPGVRLDVGPVLASPLGLSGLASRSFTGWGRHVGGARSAQQDRCAVFSTAAAGPGCPTLSDMASRTHG